MSELTTSLSRIPSEMMYIYSNVWLSNFLSYYLFSQFSKKKNVTLQRMPDHRLHQRSINSYHEVALRSLWFLSLYCLEYYHSFRSFHVRIARFLLVFTARAVNSRTSLIFNKRVESCWPPSTSLWLTWRTYATRLQHWERDSNNTPVANCNKMLS